MLLSDNDMKLTKDAFIKQINEMYDQDQRMRLSGPWDDRVDIKNTKTLQTIVLSFGWPTIPKVGLVVSNKAMIIAIHARKSPDIQAYFLCEVEKVLNDVSLQRYAYLYDNVYLNKTGKQKYGTQFTIVNGIPTPRPIENFKKVNKYRKEVGLEPLEDYLEGFKDLDIEVK